MNIITEIGVRQAQRKNKGREAVPVIDLGTHLFHDHGPGPDHDHGHRLVRRASFV
jgi:hypothetical protein